MPEPLDYRSLKGLQAALQNVRSSAGYFNDLAESQVKLDWNSDIESLVSADAPRPIVVMDVLPDSFRFVEKPDGIRHVLPVRITWIQESDPQDDDSRMLVFFRACADIEQAINAARHVEGGVWFELEVKRRGASTNEDGSRVRAEVDIEIHILRTFGVPSQL